MIKAYKIDCPNISQFDVVGVLESIEDYAGFAVLEGVGRFFYRLRVNTGETPNAEAFFSEGSLIFCNLDEAGSILEEILGKLREQDHEVSVSEQTF